VIPVLPGAVLHRCLPQVPAADGITAPFTSQAIPRLANAMYPRVLTFIVQYRFIATLEQALISPHLKLSIAHQKKRHKQRGDTLITVINVS